MENAEPKKPRPRRALLYAGATLAFLFLAALAATTAFVYWLSAPSGSDWALAYVRRSLLEPRGYHLTYDRARFALFSGFRFENLRVAWGDADPRSDREGGDVRVELAELSYSISIWRRTLDVETLTLKKPRGHANFAGGGKSPEPTQPAATSSTNFDESLRHPPARFRLKRFAIEDYDVALRSVPADAARRFALQAKGDAIRGEFSLDPGSVVASGEIAPGASFAVDARGAGASRAKLRATASAKLRFAIEDLGGREWSWRLDEMRAHAKIADFEVEQNGSKSQASEVVFGAQAKVTARSKSLGALDGSSVTDAEADVIASARGLRGPAFRIARQTANARVRLKDQIAIAFDETLEGFEMPGTIARPIGARLRAKAAVPRDLSKATVDGDVKIESVEFARFGAVVERDPGGVRIDANASLLLDRALARIAKAAASIANMGSPRIDVGAKGTYATNSGDATFEAFARAPRLLLPASKAPFATSIGAKGTWESAPKVVKATSDIDVANADFGAWRLKSQTQATFGGEIRSSGTTEIAQLALGTMLPASLPRPATVTHDFTLGAATSARIELSAPSVKVPKLGTIEGTRGRFTLSAPSGDVQEADVAIEQGRIELAPELAAKNPIPIRGAAFALKARVRGKRTFTVERFSGSLNGDMAAIAGEARGDLKTKDIYSRMTLALRAPRDFPPLGGLSVGGAVQAPFEIALRGGRALSIVGEARLNGVSAAKGEIAAEGISGALPISENLVLDPATKTARFASLIQQNPFERVNFERLRPLIERSRQLTVERVKWREKTYGPFIGYFSIQQNMAFAHQFDMDLGAGRLYGEMFLDVYPKTLRAGFLGRLTGLDLAEFLPRAFQGRVPSGNRGVSGRAGVVFDLNKSLVDGRVDVTEIGGAQLVSIINVLDPKFEDAKLNSARRVLEYGFPTGVAISFRQGYMDMDIDLKALGVSQRESVRGVPVSSLITQKTADIVRQTKKGPIQ